MDAVWVVKRYPLHIYFSTDDTIIPQSLRTPGATPRRFADKQVQGHASETFLWRKGHAPPKWSSIESLLVSHEHSKPPQQLRHFLVESFLQNQMIRIGELKLNQRSGMCRKGK